MLILFTTLFELEENWPLPARQANHFLFLFHTQIRWDTCPLATELGGFIRRNNYLINPHTPVAQKVANEVVFRRF